MCTDLGREAVVNLSDPKSTTPLPHLIHILFHIKLSGRDCLYASRKVWFLQTQWLYQHVFDSLRPATFLEPDFVEQRLSRYTIYG